MTRGQSKTDKRCCMIEAEHLPSASKTKQKKTNNKELEEKTNYALFASKQKQTDKREMRRRKIMMLHSTDNTFFFICLLQKNVVEIVLDTSPILLGWPQNGGWCSRILLQ